MAGRFLQVWAVVAMGVILVAGRWGYCERSAAIQDQSISSKQTAEKVERITREERVIDIVGIAGGAIMALGVCAGMKRMARFRKGAEAVLVD